MGITNNNESTTTEHRLRTDKNLSLNAFYWYQIFALYSAVVETQNMLSSHGGFLTVAMNHHRETCHMKDHATATYGK